MTDDAMPVPAQPLVEDSGQEEGRKFGTFAGVFMPTVLTILGAVLYLRTGWVVGNAGLLGAFAIMLLAHVITICTGLSIASVATNIRVRAGGAFSIISQSLGLEVSGSVSVPLYLAQAISVGFYLLAFSEGWQYIFPDHPQALIVFAAFGVAFGIAWLSSGAVARTQYFILGVHVISLSSVFLGSFAVANAAGMTETPVLWGDFQDGSFWVIFAVFFPAVTGILAGVNMSGTLRDARRSLPLGTMSAIGVTMLVYLLLAYWFSRVAPPEELLNNFTIIVDEAAFGPAVLGGLLAATFSAALTSMVGAPRVLQAIAERDVLPAGRVFGKQTPKGEPRPALYFTGAITVVTLAIGVLAGGLNAIAPLMTMFFLITYAVLNGVVLLEQSMGLVSFRPQFHVPRIVPLIGLLGCIGVMFLINPIFSLVALAVILALYAYLLRRHLVNPWSDVRSGLFVTLAEWAAKRVLQMPVSQERAWKPNLLVPVRETSMLLGNYRFLKALAYPRGSVHVLGFPDEGNCGRVQDLREVTQAFSRDGIFSRVAISEVNDFNRTLQTGLDVLRSVFFRPNALFLPVDETTEAATLHTMLERARANEMGVIFFAQHPAVGLGQEKVINVWIRDQSPKWEVGLRLTNLDLSLLLAYQIRRNWEGTINLITVVHEPAERDNGMQFLRRLIDLGRMPRGTQGIVEVGSFEEYLPQSPRADLHILGMQQRVDPAFIQQVVKSKEASCIFVRDSGHESALA